MSIRLSITFAVGRMSQAVLLKKASEEHGDLGDSGSSSGLACSMAVITEGQDTVRLIIVRPWLRSQTTLRKAQLEKNTTSRSHYPSGLVRAKTPYQKHPQTALK